jgi:hypothetical protein
MQTILVNMWLQPATHASRYFKDYKGTITKPDGTQDVITMDSFRADTTAYFEYVADQLGVVSSPSNPSLIYAGRAYDYYTNPNDGKTYMRCYDIRTGEVYFETLAVTTTMNFMGMIFTSVLMSTYITYTRNAFTEVPGATADVTYGVELVAISGSRLYKWNPWTGQLTVNVSVSPLTGTFHNQMEGYVLGVVGGRLINWTTVGTTTNVTARIVSNTTYSGSSLPSLIDWNEGLGASVSEITPPAMNAWYGTTIQGYDLYTGAMLWNKTLEDETLYSPMCAVADHGKVAALMMNGYFMDWDLRTGKLAWKGEAMDYPWSRAAFGAYSVQSAYGMLFREAYDGVYAYNWTDGKIVWHYEALAKSAYESPYIDKNGTTVYSFNTGATIADGKMWTYNTEHTESWPLTRGWGLHCINITDGTRVWSIGNPMSIGAVADGYLAAANPRDGYQYIFGKGKSATTVTASPKVSMHGSNVLIEGSVLDMSPAQAGTPCVSAESMTLQMEYLHLQQPIDGLWGNETITGVPVSLDVFDPNENYVHIGDVTTDGYSGTFGFTWEPEVPGQYRVTATFTGDDSYGSSFATTYVSVSEAVATATPEPPETPPDNTALLYGILVAVIIAIVIGLLAMFRKR